MVALGLVSHRDVVVWFRSRGRLRGCFIGFVHGFIKNAEGNADL